MLTIVQRGGSTHEKPPEAVRGFSSRLPWAWDGLCFAVAFNDATRDSARDLVWGAAPSAVSGLTWTRDNRGNPAAALGETSYLNYPDNPAHNKPSTALTVYVRLLRNGASVDPWGGVLCKRFSGASPPWTSWGITGDQACTSLSLTISVGGGGAYQTIDATYVLPTTEWVNAFLRWRSGEAPRLDILGDRGDVRETVVFGSTVTGTIDYAVGQPLTFNSTEVDTTNYFATYSQGMVWSRKLTDTEVQALIEDPYGWYSPRRSTVVSSSPYLLPFGGGEMHGGGGVGGLY